ncbi:MAG: peptidoglycan DD-metalloendopeptidase family protein [Vicinamibacterales bacterium]
MATIQSLDPQVTSRTGPADASSQAPSQEQVRLLAQQFESLLLSQMLREMRSSMFDEKDEATGFGGGPLSEALFSELSLALSRAGGLGLGDAMVTPITRETDPAAAAEALRAGTTGALQNLVPELRSLATGAMALPGGTPSIPLPAAAAAALPLGEAAGAGSLAALQGRVSSAYGWRDDPINGIRKFHKGLDIALAEGTDVPAARPGTVTFAGEMSGYGRTVVIEHDGGASTRYAHLSQINVKVGDVVEQGQVIAKSGSTGRVTGPHLHFEVLEGGQAVDPSEFLVPADLTKP